MRKSPHWVTELFEGRRTDVEAFRTVCYTAARRTSGKVTKVTEYIPGRSYYSANFAYEEDAFSVLVNRHHPLLAIAEPVHEEWRHPEFREFPYLVGVLGEYWPFTVLSTSELNRPLSEVDMSDLTFRRSGSRAPSPSRSQRG